MEPELQHGLTRRLVDNLLVQEPSGVQLLPGAICSFRKAEGTGDEAASDRDRLRQGPQLEGVRILSSTESMQQKWRHWYKLVTATILDVQDHPEGAGCSRWLSRLQFNLRRPHPELAITESNQTWLEVAAAHAEDDTTMMKSTVTFLAVILTHGGRTLDTHTMKTIKRWHENYRDGQSTQLPSPGAICDTAEALGLWSMP